jgi:hypothetical protein
VTEPTTDTPTPAQPAGGGFLRWLRREAIILAVMLLVGLLLPIAVFYTGQVLLGEYTDTGDGVRHLYGSVFADLFDGVPFAWALILGPWLGIVLLRVLWWPLRRRRPASAAA